VGTATFTSTFYLGLQIPVGASTSVSPGTYTGSFTLHATDLSKGTQATGTFPVTATVQKAIGITNNSALAFGAIYGGPGTVVIAPGGTRTATGSTSGFNSLTFGAASFAVSGAPSAAYSITLPTSQVALSGPGSGVYVDTFISSPSGTGTLNSTGSQALAVGATLHVPTGPVAGTYSNVFAVTVTYN
jgi:spore coat protein U-like protein